MVGDIRNSWQGGSLPRIFYCRYGDFLSVDKGDLPDTGEAAVRAAARTGKIQKCRDCYIWRCGSGFITGFFGMGLQGIIYFLFLAVLTVVTFIDMDTMEIPFMLNVIIFVMGVVSLILQFVSDAVPGSEFLAMDEVTIVSRLIGMICISLPLYLIVLFIPEGFGGGDIKLMFAAGFLLGWKATVVGFFIGLILGGIYGVICLVRRSHGKNDHFAFGPFLSVGLAIALFCGNIIMNHYIDFIKAAMNPEI